MTARRTPYRTAIFWLKLILLGWLATLTLHQIDIGGRWLPLAPTTWLFIGLWVLIYASVYWGALISNVERQPPRIPLPDGRWFTRSIFAMSIVAVVGALLITYDFAVLRQYGFGTGVAAIRALETDGAMHGEGGGSFVSGIGRPLTPALQVGWLLAVIGWGKIGKGPKIALIVATLLVFAEQSLFEGGRFFLAALIVGSLIARFGSVPEPKDVPARATVARRRIPWVRLAILLVFSLLVFSYVFIDRIQEREMFYSVAYLGFADNFSLHVNSDTVDRFDGFFGPMWFAFAMLWVYITQGVSELDTLLNTVGLAHAHGLYQVPHVGQAVLMLTGLDIRYDVFINLPNPGTYNTIYGANYIDFGHYGALISAAALALPTAIGARRLANGQLGVLAICAPILLTIGIFAPIVSLMTNLWPAIVWATIVSFTVPRAKPVRRSVAIPRRGTA